MARNLRNNGYSEGRLTRDIVSFPNADGSHKVMVNIAVPNNFKNKAGEKDSQFINLQAYVTKGIDIDKSVYGFMKKGDLVGFGYSVRSNIYEKNGETIYDQILFIEDVDLKETKKSQEARTAAQTTGPATMPEEFAGDVDEQPFE